MIRRSDPRKDKRGDNVSSPFSELIAPLPPRAAEIKGGMVDPFRATAGDLPGDKSGESGGRKTLLLPSPLTVGFGGIMD